MKKSKTKVILDCGCPEELTEFNNDYNKGLMNYCERDPKFSPDLRCLNHKGEKGICKYLKTHIYKGG